MSAPAHFPHHHVRSPGGHTVAEFVPDVGMVCCSLLHDGDQLLDPGKGLEAYAQRGATMGIPLLYPWANRIDGSDYAVAGRRVTLPEDRSRIPHDPNGLPIHGVVPGLLCWRLQPRSAEATLTARLSWRSPELLEAFPFTHEVAIDVAAAEGTLTIATTVSAGHDDRVPVSFGFHPYLRLPGSGRDSWRVQLPALERLALDGRKIPTGERHPLPPEQRDFELGATSWDDGFAVTEQPARFTVTAPGRGLAVELLEGFPYAQIYAPPGHDFICFEPMTAPTNALRSGTDLPVVDPGGAYRAVFRVSAWTE